MQLNELAPHQYYYNTYCIHHLVGETSMQSSDCPHYDSEPARLIRERLDALRDQMPTSEIASELGHQNESMLVLFADGKMRVPLDGAVPLAKALRLEPGAFYCAVYETYSPLPEGLVIEFDLARSSSRRNVDLNFKADADFHRTFKLVTRV
jgi:hypothetical protein